MSEQGFASAGSARENEELPGDTSPTAPQASLAGVDDLLDEIDSLLEDNAEEFVKSFVQKGGQ